MLISKYKGCKSPTCSPWPTRPSSFRQPRLIVFLQFAGRPQPRLAAWADDLSCVTFGLASVVTLMYYTLEAATKKMEEAGVVRPFWLGERVLGALHCSHHGQLGKGQQGPGAAAHRVTDGCWSRGVLAKRAKRQSSASLVTTPKAWPSNAPGRLQPCRLLGARGQQRDSVGGPLPGRQAQLQPAGQLPVHGARGEGFEDTHMQESGFCQPRLHCSCSRLQESSSCVCRVRSCCRIV